MLKRLYIIQSGQAFDKDWITNKKISAKNAFILSMIFTRRPKGVGKKQGCSVLAFEVLLLNKYRLSTGAIELIL